MRTLIVLLLFSISGFAQTNLDPLYYEARSGDPIKMEIHITEAADFINVYRKTGVTSTPTLLGSVPVQVDVWSYQFMSSMPSGSTLQYRFFAVPKKGAELLSESNGVRVKRIK